MLGIRDSWMFAKNAEFRPPLPAQKNIGRKLSFPGFESESFQTDCFQKINRQVKTVKCSCLCVKLALQLVSSSGILRAAEIVKIT